MSVWEIVQSPEKTFALLKKMSIEIDNLQDIKDSLNMYQLFTIYSSLNKKFMKIRSLIRALILQNETLYKAHKDFASKSLYYDILLDGWSFDTNKAVDKKPLMAFIPYAHQRPLIESFDRDEKFVHVEKARRQGISKFFDHEIKFLLVHGENEIIYATHKDLQSLDKLKGDIGHNSTFDHIRWLLDNSLWVPSNWRDGAMGGYTQEKQINLGSNQLLGAVLGKGTAVGAGATRAYIDEIDVVCDMYPNQANQLVGSFSMSVNYIYLYSTYRSMKYPFYRYKESRERGWSFYRVDWRDNPTCNNDWYEYSKSKLGNDKTLIARELDMDPTQTREGAVFAHDLSESNFYSFLPDTDKMVKVIGADFGGGMSLTSFALGYFHVESQTLYIDDCVESTKLDEFGIYERLKDKGYLGVPVFADQSAFSQIGAKGHDWNTLLRNVGIHLQAVNNKSIFLTHAKMRQSILTMNIKINKKNDLVYKHILNYCYKEDKVLKDEHSHFGDAISYLYKQLYLEKSDRGWI